jgi:hypothetical protein
MHGGATQAMLEYIVEKRQRRRCPRGWAAARTQIRRNPKGAWGLRAISVLLVDNAILLKQFL